MRKIGIGVLGVGIGGRHAWENLLTSHPQAEICDVCQHTDATRKMLEGRTIEDARRYARDRYADFMESFEDMFARDDIHIMSLMTEASVTAPYTIAAAAVGKHLVCDNPMATTLADA